MPCAAALTFMPQETLLPCLSCPIKHRLTMHLLRPASRRKPRKPRRRVRQSSTCGGKATAVTRQEVTTYGYHYIVVGNTLLAPNELQRALETGDTPQAAVSALKKAYEGKGYFLVALVAKAQERRCGCSRARPPHSRRWSRHDLVAYFSGLKGNSRIRSSECYRRSTLAQAYAATNGQQPQISFKPAPEVGGSVMQISQTPVPMRVRLVARSPPAISATVMPVTIRRKRKPMPSTMASRCK